MEENSEPFYGEDGSPLKKMFLRIWFGVTFLAVVVAFILGLVKAKDDAVMYLVVVNLLVSGVIGAIIVSEFFSSIECFVFIFTSSEINFIFQAWWFHKGSIKSKSLMFVLFVGVCIVFQAIVSDIYLYHNPNSSNDGHSNPAKSNSTITISSHMISSSSVNISLHEI
ncbi:uncharacterized protein LOC124450868 isoform X1 [Xenia sp. Carnegie-2017]|uniref:uncharacterized protein LOC124450868 isoform X1 n=1 Tax=Xenia sp. Carnegie-2017 TaxID=2897299 RepID=UPI001F035A2F|nr:uncharacterized protein LOC124450868 isoform X1 [Xenia sp. Carnegie-2017]